MQKIGKIKSWYIDPDDSRLTSTQHNILLVEVIDGTKFYAIRHDDVESDEYDAAVMTGSFELNGQEFNAFFDDIYGRRNYFNI